jgi:hypothetical protein
LILFTKKATSKHEREQKERKQQANANRKKESNSMFKFPYHHEEPKIVFDKIYGEYDIYYYSMRILKTHLYNLEKYQGICTIDLDNADDYCKLEMNINDRIIITKHELPNENVVYKIIRSIKSEHFLKFIKSYCRNNNISYTTNLNYIDMRKFLAYACIELINIYKNDMINGWTDNKWKKVESPQCKSYNL